MNLLFLTLLDFNSLDESNIYTDLLREFVKGGHRVYAISPVERCKKQKTILKKERNATILKLRIGNMQKINFIEKGISTLLIENLFVAGIKKYFSDVRFDLVLYATPPITFYKAIAYVKERDKAKTYLMLKDIFPQNAVDLGILQKTGLKGILYRYFRRKEKNLYAISDKIGCMSQANVDYILKHNSEIKIKKVEICPNSTEVIDRSVSDEEKQAIRKKYGVPDDRIVFVYGGNLGKPQGIDFLIECLREEKENEKVFFLIVGSGTEYRKVEAFIRSESPSNVKLMRSLPKDDYDRLVGSCDIGMIFLDYRFTIPNFPSRLLSYMQAKLPVFAVTDINTDLRKVIIEGELGWWCESRNMNDFKNIVEKICAEEFKQKGENGFAYLLEYYTSQNAYTIISKSIEKMEGKK